MVGRKKAIYIILIAVITACMAFSLPISLLSAEAESGTVQGSDVLDDLSADSTFSSYNYPIVADDYSISIITIAESQDNELLIYVYEPATSKDFRANYISISTSINDSIDPTIYSLTFCNRNGTLYKYLVNDFTVDTTDTVRYYEIYEIFRPFNSTVDTQASYDNKVNCPSYSVSKQWRLGSINGKSYVECDNIDTVLIDNKFVGFCRYFNGYKMFNYPSYTDSHYVAFSTPYDIDSLYEADVYFVTKSYYLGNANKTTGDDGVTWGEEVAHDITCYDTDYVSQTSSNFLHDSYSYTRIQSTSDFVSSEVGENTVTYALHDNSFVNICDTANSDLVDTCKEALNATQWVLRFYESSFSYTVDINSGLYTESSTRVSNVSILRLKFKSNGIVYNLGCVDNMQTGSDKPTNTVTHNVSLGLSDDFTDWWQEALKILAIVLGAVLFIVLLPYIFKAIAFIFKIVIKIISFIFLPLKLLFGGSGGKSKQKRR